VASEWYRDYTKESLSRGYNLAVTAIQLAAAYGVIANGGILYAPTLVKEVRAPDGTVLYRHAPEPVRRVLPEAVAERLRGFLKGAVSEQGTGSKGQIENYELVGKTGTAKVATGGRYDAGAYVASFAAIWPADRPQIVAVVKIDRPRGVYYAAQTAAPLTREVLEEALASRNQALRLDELAATPGAAPVAPQAPAPPVEVVPPVIRVAWPLGQRPVARESTAAVVPDVSGQDLRTAAAHLFKAGFQVRLTGAQGSVARTVPKAGDQLAAGGTVTLYTDNATDSR
jgi:hypothetical protein